MFDEVSFSNAAIARFGHLIPELLEERGSLHMQMGLLADALIANELLRLDIFSFISDSLQKPSVVSEIKNAVAISFLEKNQIIDFNLFLITPKIIFAIIEEQEARYRNVT